jgi:hypothetical protein
LLINVCETEDPEEEAVFIETERRLTTLLLFLLISDERLVYFAYFPFLLG